MFAIVAAVFTFDIGGKIESARPQSSLNRVRIWLHAGNHIIRNYRFLISEEKLYYGFPHGAEEEIRNRAYFHACDSDLP